MPKTTQQEIASYFFEKTGRKATPALYRQAIGNAVTLLSSGFKPQEIYIGIDYCIKHPPAKGFNSLGWLSYTLNDILADLQAEQIRNMHQAVKEFEQSTDEIIDNSKKFLEKHKTEIKTKGGKW